MQDSTSRNKHTIQLLYNNVLPLLAQHIHQNLTPIIPLFDNFVLERLLDTWTRDPATDPAEEISVENGNVHQMGLKLRLEGFRRPGVEAYDMNKNLLFILERNSYTVGPDKHNSWLERDYGQRWEQEEYEHIAQKWSEELIDDITKRLDNLTD